VCVRGSAQGPDTTAPLMIGPGGLCEGEKFQEIVSGADYGPLTLLQEYEAKIAALEARGRQAGTR
jgi:hypothetical protein